MIIGTVKLEGARELQAKLQELDKKVAKKVTRQALREGAKIVAAEAKTLAPVRSGNTRKAIKVRAGRSKKDYISVLVSVGSKWFTGKEFYAAFVEFGHFLGLKLGGKFRGEAGRKLYRRLSIAAGRKWVPGEHWLEAAYEESADKAAKVVVQKMVSGIEAVAQEKA